MSESDEQLMRQYCGGDAQAFDRLYARHRGPLYRYLLRLAGNAESDIEELFQDVWLKVIRSRDQWRADAPFKPWLYRIAHNRVMDHWRRRGRDPQQPLEDDEPAELHRPWPDAMQMLRDCVERLFQLLGELAEPQRSAFLLKEEAGLDLNQIAEVTGVGRETVKSRLRYAMKRLRSGLEGCDD